MNPCSIVILAAGNSTRLRSSMTKVLHPVSGRPMLGYSLENARALQARQIVLVVGHDAKKVEDYAREFLSDFSGVLTFVRQNERLGTAHAARLGFEQLLYPSDKVVILSGDVPLLKLASLEKLLLSSQKSPLVFLSASLDHPQGYGRVLRDASQKIRGIVEEKNATDEQRQIREINAGIYCAEGVFLKEALPQIQPNALTKEYYLPDLIPLALKQNLTVEVLPIADVTEILGANTREELAELNRLKNLEILRRHAAQGVGIQDFANTYVDVDVALGSDCFLGAGVQLLGKTKIGESVLIEPGCLIKNSIIENGVQIKAYSYLEDCVIRSEAVLGPFARIRPESVVGEKAKVGNFVELKKTSLGRGSKANHLTYLGDATIGENVNIGAGTITCNYDGEAKYPTLIEDGVFVGSDVQFVAPVHIQTGAYIAAGTTVTEDVPHSSLAIARVRQKNILSYRKKQKGQKG